MAGRTTRGPRASSSPQASRVRATRRKEVHDLEKWFAGSGVRWSERTKTRNIFKLNLYIVHTSVVVIELPLGMYYTCL